MGLTAHNKRRREMAAEGQTNALSNAEAACRNARANVALLEHNLRTAERHLAACLASHALLTAPAKAIPASYEGMKYSQLKAECKARGLDTKGKTADLLEKLQAAGE